MRINHKILSIPPYISTSWKNITSLKTVKKEKETRLEIALLDGSLIAIPDLEDVIIEAVFSSHARYLEGEPKISKAFPFPFLQFSPGKSNFFSFGGLEPIAFSEIKILSKLGALYEHDPKSEDCPDLPSEILERFKLIAQSIPFDDPEKIPKPEPGCNCPHCQITRALQTGFRKPSLPSEEETSEEEVSERDLLFTEWIIQPGRDGVYKVINPDDPTECHFVSLQSPVHCTCGEPGCLHLQTVLKT